MTDFIQIKLSRNKAFHFRNFIYERFTSGFNNCPMATFSNEVAAAAKSLQSCLTLCDPIDGSPPGSMSLGFSRQEHWSGLPFSSPMQESEKRKWSHSVMSYSSWPHGLQPIRLPSPWDLPGKSTGVGCHCLLHLMRLTQCNYRKYFLGNICLMFTMCYVPFLICLIFHGTQQVLNKRVLNV